MNAPADCTHPNPLVHAYDISSEGHRHVAQSAGGDRVSRLRDLALSEMESVA